MNCPSSYDPLSTSWRRRNSQRLFVVLALDLVVFLVLLFIAPIHAGGLQSERSPWNPFNKGVKVYQEGRCSDGYTILDVNGVPPCSVTLMDMNGNIVKEWARDLYGRGAPPPLTKLLPGGSILCFGGKISESGYYTEVQQLDWNDNLTWSFSNWKDVGGVKSAEAHHDFQREGNPVGYYAPGMEPKVTGGKTLVLSHAMVVNPAISMWQLVDPVIYEVDWDGKPTGFEWHGIDHFDEYGFSDNAKSIIKTNGGFLGDYLHMNSVSTLGPNKWYDAGDIRFNPDNIITSSRSANLITIIDRQTGHIVYKVGPDFSNSTPEGQKLGQIIGQHNAHIIPRGLPGEGNILVFDNGGFAGYPLAMRGYSRVIEFNPISLDIVWEYKYPEGNGSIPTGNDHLFYSNYISGAQRLPNCNTLITDGAYGRVFEVTTDNEIVWEYFLSGHAIYRAYRVPPEWVPGNPAGYEDWGSQ